MANQQAMSDEEAQLRRRARRRLIGAVTLVTVMVVTLPMVLDGEPKQSGQDIAINIPAPASSGDFSSKIVPVPEQAAKAETPAPAPQAETPPSAPMLEQAAPVPQPEKARPAAAPAEKVVEAKTEPANQEEKPADKPKETKPAAKTAEHAGGSHIILLGAFLSEANAKQRQARLKEIGVKFYLEKIKSPAGEKTAVRAGPYSSRQEAERALAKLKAAGIQDGIVAEKKG